MNLTGKYIKCEYCGKEFYVTQTRLKRSKTLTCSRECASNLKKESFREIRVCEWCHEEYTTKKSSPQRFCSVVCQNEWQKTNVGHKNPKFKGETIPCEYCGELYDVHKYNLDKYEHHFCSVKCRKDWHKNVFSQDDEWKEKSRIRGAKATKCMSLNTKPQLLINELLNNLNIEFTNEYNIKYYSVDNYLINENLMIEVMGDYWHYNPTTYNLQPTERQLKTIRKDTAKHTYIKRYYNIDVLYLWEHDIYKNIELCKELIIKYIKDKGVLNSYHSFNYYIDKNELCLKDNQIEIYNTIQNPVTTTV